MGKTPSWLSGRSARTTLFACLLGLPVMTIAQSDHCAAAFPGTNAKIAYSLGDPSLDSIWSANADGSLPARLTDGSEDHEPAYSAAGSEITFERGNDVVVMNADGSQAKRVLAGRTLNTSTASWVSNYKAPAGGSIPFVKITTVTTESYYFRDPSFSPDGSWLVVVEEVEDTVSTTTCAVGEEEGQECLAGSDPDAYFDYQSDCECRSQIIEVKSEDGGLIKKITPSESETRFQSPVYSAGGVLAYVRSSPSTPGSAIFVIRQPGAVPQQITSGPKDYAPDFSPNGLRIVFSHGESDIGLVGSAGGADYSSRRESTWI